MRGIIEPLDADFDEAVGKVVKKEKKDASKKSKSGRLKERQVRKSASPQVRKSASPIRKDLPG